MTVHWFHLMTPVHLNLSAARKVKALIQGEINVLEEDLWNDPPEDV